MDYTAGARTNYAHKGAYFHFPVLHVRPAVHRPPFRRPIGGHGAAGKRARAQQTTRGGQVHHVPSGTSPAAPSPPERRHPHNTVRIRRFFGGVVGAGPTEVGTPAADLAEAARHEN